jgi:DNA-binding transcriptional LysR family regulator
MSQPAVSNALRRARKLTQDQLFLKVADGVQPTARMLAIWPELHRSLAVIRASARIAFSVHTNAGSLDGIERGTLDCAVGMFPALPRVIHVPEPSHGSLRVRDATRAQVVARNDPGAVRGGFARGGDPSGTDLGVVDGWLSLSGRTRTIVAIVNHFAHALRIVGESDLLTCVPSGFLEGPGRTLVEQHDLVVRDLPFETEKLIYKLVWHERLHVHPAHQWFRSLVADICR